MCHSKACTSSLEHFVNDCGNSMKKSGVQSLLRTMNCSHHFYPTAAKKDDGHDATEPEPEYQPEPEPAVQPSPKHTGPVRPIPTNQPGPLRSARLGWPLKAAPIQSTAHEHKRNPSAQPFVHSVFLSQTGSVSEHSLPSWNPL